MISKRSFKIKFADIVIEFIFPTNANLTDELAAFLVDDSTMVHAEYRAELIDAPLILPDKEVAECWEMKIFQKENGWLRVYLPLIEKNGCQVACETHKSGKNKLYYPAERWDFYSKKLHCLHLLGIEEILLANNAFLLHSSMVEVNGEVILFSGPSGIGKSTQALLWERVLGAEVLNGDRCIVCKKEDGFYGSGSPWCGTSGIYRNEQAPLKGIVLLKQEKENSIKRIKSGAFARVLQQTIVNSWNTEFMVGITELIGEVLATIPVYELSCRPDEDAVWLTYRTLFEGEH